MDDTLLGTVNVFDGASNRSPTCSKIHSEAFFASELAETEPAEREPISFEERVSNSNLRYL